MHGGKSMRIKHLRVLLLLSALGMALATGNASADPVHRSNGSRFFNNGHGFNNGFNIHFSYNRNNRFNSRNSWNRNFRRNDIYGSRYNYRPYRHNGWSASLNYGTGYNTWYGTSLLAGIGAGYAYTPWRNQTTVVYTQPRVVYVNDSSRVTGRVIERVVDRPSAGPARSLLRDIHGDCYERAYDSRGVETRVQLPASACNF